MYIIYLYIIYIYIYIIHLYEYIECHGRARLEIMREMYNNEAQFSPGATERMLDPLEGGDPFYDRFPWFRRVGRYAV